MDEGMSNNIIFKNNSQKLKIPNNLKTDELQIETTIEVIILPE